MSLVSQLGLEFDVLHALLDEFVSISVPTNEELQVRRDRLNSGAEAVNRASTTYKDGLAGMDGRLEALQARLASGSAAYGEVADASRDAVSHASAALDAAEQATVQRANACAEENGRVRQSLLDEGTATSEAFGRAHTSFTEAQTVLTALQAAAMGLLAEALTSVDKQGAALSQHGVDVATDLDAHRSGLEQESTHGVPDAFQRVQTWVEQDLTRAHATTISTAQSAADATFTRTRGLVDKTVGDAGRDVNHAFDAATRAIDGSQQQLSARVKGHTSSFLGALLGAQSQVAQTFDPGLGNARKCAENFPRLKRNVDILKEALHL